LPRGRDVKGTEVEDTRPIVYSIYSVSFQKTDRMNCIVWLTLKGVKILDSCNALLGTSFPFNLCLFTTGPSRELRIREEGIFGTYWVRKLK